MSSKKTLLIAAGTVVAAAATAVYGAYGDPSDPAGQQQDVPYIIGAGLVVAALLFGLLVPWAARRSERAGGWGLAASVLALVSFPVMFWSGVPLILAATGGRLGAAARPAGLGRAAVVVGVVAAVLSTGLLILGNTVLAG